MNNIKFLIPGRNLIRYSMVGGVGFFIEAFLLTIVSPELGAIKGRLVSFPVAVFATWWLNRRYTFNSKNNPHKESFRYFLVQVLGAFSNLASYTLLVFAFPKIGLIPVIPLGFASIVGLLVNYNLSRKFVFSPYKQ